METNTFILIHFLWNLLPESVQDKIKEVSVNKAYTFLESAFSEESTISNAFWKALEQVVADVYIDSSKESIKYRFQQALLTPEVKTQIIRFCQQVPVTEVANSLKNEIYWKDILTETFQAVQMSNWQLDENDKNFFFSILMAQYLSFKRNFIHYLSINAEESIKVLLSSTLETQSHTNQILIAINKLVQGMIGQIQDVHFYKGNNLALIDVKGKQIAISPQALNPELSKQVLYIISDKQESEYINLKTEIERRLSAKRSELDEYNLYIEGQDLNYNAESSRAIYGKTPTDLDKKALKILFNTELAKQHLRKHGINQKTSIEIKLRTLFLMSNGYVVKGTFLCLCSAIAIRSVNTTADYISFGVYMSKDRTRIKVAQEFDGNLITQFTDVEDALILNLGPLEIVDLMKRELDYIIPQFVFRELIANAVVHRDYSENAKIHTTIELYEDRFVVRNPGVFPEHIDPSDIENIQHKSINKEIARIFFLHGIVQKKGSGIQRVQQTLKERGMRPAIFEQKDGIVTVTVYKKEPISFLYEKAQAYHDKGDYTQELEYRKEALSIQEKKLSPTDPDLSRAYANIASTYKSMGDLENSLNYIQKALIIEESILSPNHTALAAVYNNVSTIYQDMGDLTQSLDYGLKALKIQENIPNLDQINLANLYSNLAFLYENLGNLNKSLEYGLKAEKILEKKGTSAYRNLYHTYNIIGNTYRTLGNLAKSLEYELKSLNIREKMYPPLHPDLATIYANIGTLYQEMNDIEKSIEYGHKALDIREKILPANHPALAHSYHNLAITYSALGELGMALDYIQKALIILLKTYPFGHISTKASVNVMATILQKTNDAKVAAYRQWFLKNCSEYLKA